MSRSAFSDWILHWLPIPLVTIGITTSCEDPAGYEPLGDDCLACLSKNSKGGCKAEWDICDDQPTCSSYATCQLQALCYAQEPGAGCEQDVGCRRPSASTADAGAVSTDAGGGEPTSMPGEGGMSSEEGRTNPRQAADDFEHCARTSCAKRCCFVAP